MGNSAEAGASRPGWPGCTGETRNKEEIMEGAALIADALGRVNGILHRSLKGAPAGMLCRMPAPHANSMAWLAWHLTRAQDDHISDLAGLPAPGGSGGGGARVWRGA